MRAGGFISHVRVDHNLADSEVVEILEALGVELRVLEIYHCRHGLNRSDEQEMAIGVT